MQMMQLYLPLDPLQHGLIFSLPVMRSNYHFLIIEMQIRQRT